MSGPRRVLFLTALPLDRPRGGGTIKSAALLAHLERSHAVDVACLSPSPSAWTRSSGETVVVPLAKPRSAGRLLRSYLARVPLSVERNHAPAFASAVDDLLARRRHDVVFIDGWLMAQYIPSGFDGLRLLHEHNVEHQMWERHAAVERTLVRRALVRAEARRVRAYEAWLLPGFDVVFAVSEADRRALVELGAPGEGTRLLPNVPDVALLERPALDPPAEPVVLFLGTLSWPPNAEGLRRFLREGVQPLRARVSEACVVVAGRSPGSSLVETIERTPGAELLADVDDDESLYRRARCFVDASVGGAGTRVKILNAMARGVPVVATADAATGLEAQRDVHLLVERDPASLVEPIVRVLTDDELWRRLSADGRRLVAERYVAPGAFVALDEALAGSGE